VGDLEHRRASKAGGQIVEFDPRTYDVLQHDPIQGQIRHDLLQPRILVAELLQLVRLTGQHAAVHLLPAVERLLGNPDLVRATNQSRAPSRSAELTRVRLAEADRASSPRCRVESAMG
jgi:hypothetical protein